jgi:tight adherence protein B
VNALVALAFGAAIGLGVLLIICGAAGRRVVPGRRRREERITRGWLAVAVGLAGGFAVYGVTHWLVAGLLAGIAVGNAPRFLAGRRRHEQEIRRVEAIASWAEMLRDTIAGAAGLEQAIAATGPIAPAPIAGPVARLAARLDYEPLPVALRRFADEVDHPTADFVVAALVIAAEKEARVLGRLLGQLAVCARDEAKMRTRIWIDRAKTRTSVTVIAGCVLAFAGGLLTFSRTYLEPYDDAVGQVVLLVIGGLFFASLAGMDRMARVAVPERFVRRRAS